MGEALDKPYKDWFYVFHDWYSGRGDVDHFVVGLQGVFVAETKACTGEITSKDRKTLRDDKPDKGKDPITQAKGEAADVSKLIKDSRGLGTWVHPVLCFSEPSYAATRPSEA